MSQEADALHALLSQFASDGTLPASDNRMEAAHSPRLHATAKALRSGTRSNRARSRSDNWENF